MYVEKHKCYVLIGKEQGQKPTRCEIERPLCDHLKPLEH